MQLHDSRIAVTGAGGFIGRALCARLEAEGAECVRIDRSPGEAITVADITDAAAIAAAIDGCNGIVHTAAVVSDWGSMEEFVRVNVVGTRNVLDAAQAAGAQRTVHVSSVATWGYDFASDVAESSPPRATGAPYIDTKAASQWLALRRGAAVVRPGDVYGPGSVPWILRPLEALRSGSFYLPGRGDGVMTPVYVDDLVDCLVRALTNEEAGGQAFTAWDGTPVAARDFFAHHARWAGKDGVRTLPRPVLKAAALGQELAARARGRAPEVSRQALIYVSRKAAYPNTRARELLGWAPQVELPEGMRRTEEWLRAEGLLAHG